MHTTPLCYSSIINCAFICVRQRWAPTWPLMATGRSLTACMPRIAAWGGLRMGVPISEPKTPAR